MQNGQSNFQPRNRQPNMRPEIVQGKLSTIAFSNGNRLLIDPDTEMYTTTARQFDLSELQSRDSPPALHHNKPDYVWFKKGNKTLFKPRVQVPSLGSYHATFILNPNEGPAITRKTIQHFKNRCCMCGMNDHVATNTGCPLYRATGTWRLCTTCYAGYHDPADCKPHGPQNATVTCSRFQKTRCCVASKTGLQRYRSHDSRTTE